MFFINRIAGWRRLDYFLVHWVPTLVILLAFLGVTVWSWQNARERADTERTDILSQNIKRTGESTSARMNAYENIARGAASFIESRQNISQTEWNNFIDDFNIQSRYSGIRSISYVRSQPPNAATVQLVSSIDDNSTRPQIGQNVYAENTLRSAITTAARSGEMTFSGKILHNDANVADRPGFNAYFPVFPSGQSSGSFTDTAGFIQMEIQANSLFENSLISGEDLSTYGYRIFAGEPSAENVLYQSNSFASLASSAGSKSQTTSINIGGQTWTLEIIGGQSAGTPELQYRPDSILISGTIFGLLTSAFVYILLTSRTRSVSQTEERQVQEAKDELLALASHQLRTPATGVKQYIGMLREGFAGDITSDQKKILDKAYAANERQLITINEMLSVARADTGRLPMDRSTINLKGLVEDVANEIWPSIKERNQNLNLKLPRSAIYAEVDPAYMRMAIENVVNNASKYTPERGDIDIRLSQKGSRAVIAIDDTGVGIPERHYPLLFKKFSRIPNELSNQVSGTGIGLYLAKHIVEAHGGKLSFSSEAGVGSSFEITLRAKKKNQ